METYENTVVRRIGYVFFLLVILVYMLGIGNGDAEMPVNEHRVGDIVTFGVYDQDNNAENGAEPIKWIVLAAKDGQYLLLSRNGLDAMPFHNGEEDTDWEHCSLRTWLNNDFLQQAFIQDARKAIRTTLVSNSKDQGSANSASGGADTQDRIFLLSWKEAFKDYMSVNAARMCQPTETAKAHGALYSAGTNGLDISAPWLLRSPADSLMNTMIVEHDGAEMFCNIHLGQNMVRPALWVSANAPGLE